MDASLADKCFRRIPPSHTSRVVETRINYFDKNKPTEQGFQLGRKLFYDGRLSKDGEVSCASCHQPFGSFATYDHDLSHGVSNALSTRNAPVLVNLA